ncbi:hypothetical protein ONS95_005158 [Cadophora gregata]|uniref:uncharacterized protein n=1 Tax=Cadophora gregata TaxID=51156 RepID=UPI0026DC1357|nr:uncharacterized protein ONS95_005158 [Cadophora gregata]KAK0104893.1 hypothetical protein ONS95_005158 [Cadophora gregata]KAK0115029.1 hypothetical protein ONS96_013498 [Cadophora gregata f. sp. sojae]
MFWYARQQGVLREEPVGILSPAGMVIGSDLLEKMKSLKEKTNYDGKMMSATKTSFPDLETRTCKMENSANPRTARIVMMPNTQHSSDTAR